MMKKKEFKEMQKIVQPYPRYLKRLNEGKIEVILNPSKWFPGRRVEGKTSRGVLHQGKLLFTAKGLISKEYWIRVVECDDEKIRTLYSVRPIEGF